MGRRLLVDVGINGAFLARRWEKPENWMRLTRQMGYKYHEFCSDVLDPFFSGDHDFQMNEAKRIREAAAKYGITITDVYTGVATHRFHGLAHSNPVVRDKMKHWILDSMDLALAMGTDRIGGHWDALSCEVLADPHRTTEMTKILYHTFRELAIVGQQKGLKGIYVEQMYLPSELPYTLKGAEEYLGGVNQANPGCPIYLTVDVGHQAGKPYGVSGPSPDYEEWVRRFGAASEIIHIQQTKGDSSCHWPFTEEFNQQGTVNINTVLDALRWSHEHIEELPWAQHLRPAERTILILEVIPSATQTESKLLDDLERSADYLRNFVPKTGLHWSFEV